MNKPKPRPKPKPKPWSITTTVRNPNRLRNFLVVLQQFENLEWNYENQKKYQILLIQNRVYGYGRQQFYDGLREEQIKLIANPLSPISFEKAQEIFDTQAYEDPPMRGRQSINVLKKFGFVLIEKNKIKITDMGKLLLEEDSDLGEIFPRIFFKWQIPNLPKDSSICNIKPFIGALHLIHSVNEKERLRDNKPKGISKREFSLFVPTLVHYSDIDHYAEQIISLRDSLQGQTSERQEEIFAARSSEFAGNFVEEDDQQKIQKLLKNLRDYGDNAIRYFRLTRYIYIRGNGFYIDLEPRRSIEIQSLLAHDRGQAQTFASKTKYLAYLSDITQPQLPWETKEKYFEIVSDLTQAIQKYETQPGKDVSPIKPLERLHDDELKDYVAELRSYLRQLQDEEHLKKSQESEGLKWCICKLKNIYKYEHRPILLEQLSTFGLRALNDALKIQPNYPVGDDGEPTYTAPANIPDIECFYENFNAICEVTMQKDRNQWYHEGQPVMRHLRDFEDKHKGKPHYCLFIAPKLHRDTINTFWAAIKMEYEGRQQKIIPLQIDAFVSILEILLKMKTDQKFLKHSDISRLYDAILQSAQSYKDSTKWIKTIPDTISAWGQTLVVQS